MNNNKIKLNLCEKVVVQFWKGMGEELNLGSHPVKDVNQVVKEYKLKI